MRTPNAAFVFLATTASVLALSSDSRAGATASYATCGVFGYPFCEGTYAGFRGTSNSTDYFDFNANGGSSASPVLSFTASLNGTNYTCTVNAASYPSVASLWPTSVGPGFYFFIQWNSSGTCILLDTIKGSEY